jgi:hypothetical protein
MATAKSNVTKISKGIPIPADIDLAERIVRSARSTALKSGVATDQVAAMRIMFETIQVLSDGADNKVNYLARHGNEIADSLHKDIDAFRGKWVQFAQALGDEDADVAMRILAEE